MLKIGSHVSYSTFGLEGATKEILNYGANAFMFYTGAPQNTIRKEINLEDVKKAHELMKSNNIDLNDVLVHAPYIVNLASAEPIKADFALQFMKQEIARIKLLGINNLVVHPGSAVGITKKEGLDNLINILKELLKEKMYIYVETMAGKGNELCTNLEELSYVINTINDPYLKVCLDTCHLSDSGVDLSKFDDYLNEFDKQIGINKIGFIHVNDSKNDVGAKKDRHENFGFGTIGFDNLLHICYHEKLKDVPKILETPYVDEGKKSFPPYKFEIEMIKNKKLNTNLIEDIKKHYLK